MPKISHFYFVETIENKKHRFQVVFFVYFMRSDKFTQSRLVYFYRFAARRELWARVTT